MFDASIETACPLFVFVHESFSTSQPQEKPAILGSCYTRSAITTQVEPLS